MAKAVVERIAHKIITPSKPPAITIFIHILAKLLVIDFLLKVSVVVQLVEERDRIIWIQLVINDLILAEYDNVLGSVNEVV